MRDDLTNAMQAENLSAIQPSDWSYERAAHLLERAGFGGTPGQIEALAARRWRSARL